MAEMWYYTTEGKQMDPVTIRELKQLVGDGTLKPTDMVWKEGMARWIRASSLKELFPDPSSLLDQYFSDTRDSQNKEVTSSSSAVTASPAKCEVVAAAESSSKKSAPGSEGEPQSSKK